MDPTLFGAFCVAAVVLICTPGADWAYCISAGINQRRALPAVAGLTTGYLVHTSLITAGVAAVVLAVPVLLDVLTYVGVGYLVWLGVSTLRSAAAASYGGGTAGAGGGYGRGVATSLSNPKALLMFLALMPQFVSATASYPMWLQLALLGVSYTLATFAVYTGVALTAKTVLVGRPAAAKAVTRVSGATMIALAVALVVEQVFVG